METAKPSYNTFRKICRIGEEILGYNNITVIFEYGSRYGEDTIEFAKRYPNAKIYGFECNETTIPLCKKNTELYPNILLTEKAVSNHDGAITFYPIDKGKTITTWEDGNQGASSLLKASGKYKVESYVQKETTVQGVTLKTFMDEHSISHIDIMWMDIQGAELMAFEGLKDRIKDVKIIQCEVEKIEIYKNQPLYDTIKEFLLMNGFCFMGYSANGDYSADAVFVRKDLVNRKLLRLCDKILLIEKNKSLIRSLKNYLLYKTLILLKHFRRFNPSFKVTIPPNTNKEYIHWKMQIYNPLLGNDVQFRKKVWSNEAIDVVIPTHPKDINILRYCIDSVKKNIKHPIGDIFIISSKNPTIEKIAKENKCVFIDECNVIRNLSPNDIKYIINGKDRSGWLFQQLIKLSVNNISRKKYCLVIDSDTIFNRPIKYLHQGKIILNVSDERHEPYYVAYRNIFKEDIISEDSFVAHAMLFDCHILSEMQHHIETLNKKDWITTILNNVEYTDISGFSEYETYGNYILRHHPSKVKLEYWFNKSINHYNEFAKIPNYYKTISLHNYNIKND